MRTAINRRSLRFFDLEYGDHLDYSDCTRRMRRVNEDNLYCYRVDIIVDHFAEVGHIQHIRALDIHFTVVDGVVEGGYFEDAFAPSESSQSLSPSSKASASAYTTSLIWMLAWSCKENRSVGGPYHPPNCVALPFMAVTVAGSDCMRPDFLEVIRRSGSRLGNELGFMVSSTFSCAQKVMMDFNCSPAPKRWQGSVVLGGCYV